MLWEEPSTQHRSGKELSEGVQGEMLQVHLGGRMRILSWEGRQHMQGFTVTESVQERTVPSKLHPMWGRQSMLCPVL